MFTICAALLTGCAGSHDTRPSLPDGSTSIPVLMAAGDSAAARGATGQAREAYARAATAAKRAGVRDLEARAELKAGLSSLALGEPESARRSLTRAVALDPASAEIHLALGRFHTATRRYADAKAEFGRAATLDTVSAEPWYQMGLAYAQAGDVNAAADAFGRALERDPSHAPSQTALAAVLDSRYVVAGLPTGYGALRTHLSISRGELGVMLAAELGVDPERPSWNARKDRPSDSEEARGAWGERWVRAAMARGWISPFPDGSYHLGDPVTRGALALLVMEIEADGRGSAGGGPDAPEPSPSLSEPFPDLGPRHYLLRAARSAVALGLPLRTEGRFEPWASATGSEARMALRGLARSLALQPVVPEEPGQDGVVK